MERGKMSSSGRGGKSKVPQHPQDIFALGSKSTVVVSRDSEKRNIHKPSTSGAERKREPAGFGPQPPVKRSRIGSPAEAVGGVSLEVDPVDLVPNVLQALDTHNSDKLLGLLTGSIRLLKSQRSKPDPILCMGMLYLTKIRPNMFAHDTMTQSLCTLLKREQGAAFKSKGNPLVFVLACNMLYAGHKDSNNWPDIFIKVYIEDALNERWWVDCAWCKCLVENIVTAFNTKHPPAHLIPSDNTLGTMSPSGSGSPLMGSTDEDTDNTELEYSVFPRYTGSYEQVEMLVLEAIKEQIQRRAAPDAIGKGFLKLLSATCGFPEIRMISASRLETWLHSGKLWRCAQELLAHVCVNTGGEGVPPPRDHEVLAQLARMRLKTKPLQAAYHLCLREMVSESPALLRSVVTHTIYNELSNVRAPNNMGVLAALVQAQPQLVPAAMATTYQELLLRPEEYLRPLRALTRECVRAARADVCALLPLARGLAAAPAPVDAQHEGTREIRERAFAALADLFCLCCLITAAHSKHLPEYKQQMCSIQGIALGWLLDTAMPEFRPSTHQYRAALNKLLFVEPADTYSKLDNWPPESERAATYRLCCEMPLPQNSLLRLIFIGLSKDIPVGAAEVVDLVEQITRRACALPPEESPLVVDKLDVGEYLMQLTQFTPPDNIALPAGYTPPPLAITSLYWRCWVVLVLVAAHNPSSFAERAAATYPTLRALLETCITSRPSVEWTSGATDIERNEAEKNSILTLETHLAAASQAKVPVTEHNSRLLSQLTQFDPLGPARKPPAAVLESLSAACAQLRLGQLLCRQPALLLDLLERHGTRRAMPWLHHLLKHDTLHLSVLPVQCLCEFLCAGVGEEGGGGKAGELAAHLRAAVAASEAGARAVLHYYTQRLAHAHRQTRAAANRGMKLVLTTAQDVDYNADVNPEEWLDLLWDLRHWDAVGAEVVSRIRAACGVECTPKYLQAYIAFLAKYVARNPHLDHTDIALELSQVLMERMTVATHTVNPTCLHHLTYILYTHLRQVFSGASEQSAASTAGGPRVQLVWAGGRHALLHMLLAHAHVKLLCYPPAPDDTNQEMYTWLQSVWIDDPPQAFLQDSNEEAVLLPDWLRLHMVRSARPALLEAGLRGLPAHKLALFIQTFGMPVASMSALLAALDACPAGAIARLGVERGYMKQLLRVQRARGATGGEAFAAALKLAHQTPELPQVEECLFESTPLPPEPVSVWSSPAGASHVTVGTSIPPLVPTMAPCILPLPHVPGLLSAALGGRPSRLVDLDKNFTQLTSVIAAELQRGAADMSRCPYTEATCYFLQRSLSTEPAFVQALLQRPYYSANLLRVLDVGHPQIAAMAESLLCQLKCASGPVVDVLRALAKHERVALATKLPANPTREQLVAVLETATPSTLEPLGNQMIQTQPPSVSIDVITQLLENSHHGKYNVKVKTEEGDHGGHILGRQGLGCGLLVDWLCELRQEIIVPHSDRQMELMFTEGCGGRVGELAAAVAHRASWTTLRHCMHRLLAPRAQGKWSARYVLELVATVAGGDHLDSLNLSHEQMEVLMGYIITEADEHLRRGNDMETVRLMMERRLSVVGARCGSREATLGGALAALSGPDPAAPLCLLQLLMQTPLIAQLLEECVEISDGAGRAACGAAVRVGAEGGAGSGGGAAADRVSHALLTALQADTRQPHHHKLSRMESHLRAVWTRISHAGVRALPLAGALLRARTNTRHHYLLSAIEALPDHELFHEHPAARESLHGILEWYLDACGGRERGERGEGGSVPHRVCALLRRYLAAAPPAAQAFIHAHAQTIAGVPALAAVTGAEVWARGSDAPPPHALLPLEGRREPRDLLVPLQDIEAWGGRRGGNWGGRGVATRLARALAPLCSSPALSTHAWGPLARVLPALEDPTPGLHAVLECLESNQPEVSLAVLDKLPDLIVGMQEHANTILMQVFTLGMKSRLPVEQAISKCVTTINLHRGC